MEIKQGINTGVASSFEEAEKFAVESGFDVLEVHAEFVEVSKPGFDIAYTIHAPFKDADISAVDAEVRKHAVEGVEKSIALARRLGAELVVFHPCRSNSNRELVHKYVREALEDLLPVAEEYGVFLGLENMDPRKGVFEDIAECIDVIEGSKYLKLVLDLNHHWLNLCNFSNSYALMFDDIEFAKPYIGEIHIADAIKGEVRGHYAIGKGNIDFKPVLRALKHIDYSGYCVIEGPIADKLSALESQKKLKELCSIL